MAEAVIGLSGRASATGGGGEKGLRRRKMVEVGGCVGPTSNRRQGPAGVGGWKQSWRKTSFFAMRMRIWVEIFLISQFVRAFLHLLARMVDFCN